MAGIVQLDTQDLQDTTLLARFLWNDRLWKRAHKLTIAQVTKNARNEYEVPNYQLVARNRTTQQLVRVFENEEAFQAFFSEPANREAHHFVTEDMRQSYELRIMDRAPTVEDLTPGVSAYVLHREGEENRGFYVIDQNADHPAVQKLDNAEHPLDQIVAAVDTDVPLYGLIIKKREAIQRATGFDPAAYKPVPVQRTHNETDKSLMMRLAVEQLRAENPDKEISIHYFDDDEPSLTSCNHEVLALDEGKNKTRLNPLRVENSSHSVEHYVNSLAPNSYISTAIFRAFSNPKLPPVAIAVLLLGIAGLALGTCGAAGVGLAAAGGIVLIASSLSAGALAFGSGCAFFGGKKISNHKADEARTVLQKEFAPALAAWTL